MGRICYLCHSPNRSKYDQMRLEGKGIYEVQEYAKTVCKEDFEYWHFQKHFANHLIIGEPDLENLGRMFLKLVKEANHLLSKRRRMNRRLNSLKRTADLGGQHDI